MLAKLKCSNSIEIFILNIIKGSYQMRLYLTIGELAKLLDTSTYNIRYYEKEGLIKPTKLSESGYRLYDYEEVYALSTIMLLRDCDIPIKEIKELFTSFNSDKYKETLNISFQKIDREIKRLQAVKEEIRNKLNGLKRIENKEAIFEVKTLAKKRVYHIKSSDFEMDYSLKELYDLSNQHQLNFKDFYKSDFYFIIRDQEIITGHFDNDRSYDLDATVFGRGEYLCYSFIVNHDDELEERMEEMFDYLHQHKMVFESDLLLIIDGKTSFNDVSCLGELQIKIG